MAQVISATIYGINENDLNSQTAQPGTPGITMAFSVQTITLQSIPPTSYSGTVCNTRIIVLPTAPSPIQQRYYTNTAIGALVTAANA
jgi:hypothetical protein